MLTALYRPTQLHGHLIRAINNGVTKSKIREMITHVAFYAGWPSSVSAAIVANEALKDIP